MKCDQCQNEASVFLTEFNNGEVRKVNLCEECARERSIVEEATGLELKDLLWGLGNAEKVSLETEDAEQELLCPACGFSDADFDKSERLGCPECYEVFAGRLNGMWKNFQKGEVHVGKRMELREGAPAYPSGITTAGAKPHTPSTGQVKPAVEVDAEVPATAHQGRSSMEGEARERSLERQLTELHAQMQEALREEAYEHAATLRDAIRTIEKDLANAASAPAQVE